MSGKLIVLYKLAATSAVTAVVGQRIWSNRPSSNNAEKTFILVSQPGGENRQILEGNADYPRSRVRVECYGGSPAEAAAVRSVAFETIKNVTNEVVDDGDSPPAFSATATITPTDFNIDGYSDARESDVEIFDVYVDWRS